MNDPFRARGTLKVGEKQYVIYRLAELEKAGITDLKRLPFSIRIMLEAALRQCNGREITEEDVRHIAAWTPAADPKGRPGIVQFRNRGGSDLGEFKFCRAGFAGSRYPGSLESLSSHPSKLAWG